MHVFHELSDVLSHADATSVAIGNFDGIHIGHQALLKSMMDRAKGKGLTPTVLTFFPHPVEVLQPQKKLERLTTTSEKLALLEAVGVEQVLVAKFDAHLAGLSPEEFFKIYLLNGLKARSIHVGFNFCFGKGRKGDTSTLQQLADAAGIHLQVEAQVDANGQRVSSSVVRKAIAAGEVAQARVLLGRPYHITGQVSKGDQRGRQLGFPTANLRCPAEKVLPSNGVYVTRVQWQKQDFKAVTNVGIRPTFASGGVPTPLVEVHILDFNAQIYDEFLEVEFLDRIRSEQKFSGIEELKTQIQKDADTARRSTAF